MEIQTNRRMQVYMFIVKLFYVVIVILNLTLSVYEDELFHPDIFGILDILFWFYGVLCAHGVFKKAISDPNSDGLIEYEIKIPYPQVAIMRVIQIAYSLLFKLDSFSIIKLGVLLGCDVIYTVFLLVYKASYYYISLPIDENE